MRICSLKNLKAKNTDLDQYFQANSVSIDPLQLYDMTGKQGCFIGNPAEFNLKKKIESNGKPLKEWDIKINYGIKTGLNEAFIINTAKRDELINQDPKSAEIIKPILRGRDIKRYGYQWADLWVINTHNGYKTNSPSKIDNMEMEYSPSVKGWQSQTGGVVFDHSNQNTSFNNSISYCEQNCRPHIPIQSKTTSIPRDTIQFMSLPYNQKLKERAKELRKAGNLSEVILWNMIKNKQLLGLDFDRQKIIGNYIVDFYCPNLGLVIEIDGESHDFKGEHDVQREFFLRSLGLEVMHFEDIALKKDSATVSQQLFEVCKKLFDDLELQKLPRQSATATPSQKGNLPSDNISQKENIPVDISSTKENFPTVLIPAIDINDYPFIKAHLDQFQPALTNRSDQGKTPYNMRNCAYLEEFNKEKVVYSEIVQEPQFYLDTKGEYFAEATTFLMTGEKLRLVMAILHSKAGVYFFKNYYAGGGLGENGFRYKKAFLENLPIPTLDTTHKQELARQIEVIVEQILLAKSNGLPRQPLVATPSTKGNTPVGDISQNGNFPIDTLKLESKIDKLVYQLYDLTTEEIGVVEG